LILLDIAREAFSIKNEGMAFAWTVLAGGDSTSCGGSAKSASFYFAVQRLNSWFFLWDGRNFLLISAFVPESEGGFGSFLRNLVRRNDNWVKALSFFLHL